MVAHMHKHTHTHAHTHAHTHTHTHTHTHAHTHTHTHPHTQHTGNNYFGEEVGTVLRRIGRSPEREAYILMDRVRPPTQQGFILRPGISQLVPIPLISELGIFGVYVK